MFSLISSFENNTQIIIMLNNTGVALRNTPIGLAAYILEKFSTWTDVNWRSLPDGGLTRKYRLTDLLDNVMIYWVTGSITTSARLYSETFSKAQFALNLDRLVFQII
jgi:juvenile hormone epoxide hydrolase